MFSLSLCLIPNLKCLICYFWRRYCASQPNILIYFNVSWILFPNIEPSERWARLFCTIVFPFLLKKKKNSAVNFLYKLLVGIVEIKLPETFVRQVWKNSENSEYKTANARFDASTLIMAVYWVFHPRDVLGQSKDKILISY